METLGDLGVFLGGLGLLLTGLGVLWGVTEWRDSQKRE
jgi:hypothetical protein